MKLVARPDFFGFESFSEDRDDGSLALTFLLDDLLSLEEYGFTVEASYYLFDDPTGYELDALPLLFKPDGLHGNLPLATMFIYEIDQYPGLSYDVGCQRA